MHTIDRLKPFFTRATSLRSEPPAVFSPLFPDPHEREMILHIEPTYPASRIIAEDSRGCNWLCAVRVLRTLARRLLEQLLRSVRHRVEGSVQHSGALGQHWSFECQKCHSHTSRNSEKTVVRCSLPNLLNSSSRKSMSVRRFWMPASLMTGTSGPTRTFF